jgi:undecaprenyl-diphosphatase
MTFLHSIVLGIIQGIGEFLPISSSAHLILVPWVMGWDDGGLTFDVALHAGTLVALLIYFRQQWIQLVKGLFRVRPHHLKDLKTLNEDPMAKMALFVLIGTIPGAIMGLALEKKAEHAFRDPRLIAVNLAIMGAILWYLDRRGKKQKTLDEMTLKDGLIVGIAQGFAVIPGVSRAGITISAALAQGYQRTPAATFSFFLSMPIIAGACILKLRHLTGADITPVFLAGIGAAAIAGLIAISGLMQYLRTRSYGVFAVYRFVIAIAVFGYIFAHGL